jgi:hypothetical protein
VNGAIHATTTEQSAVGSIDDGVNDLFGEVADDKADTVVEIAMQSGSHG